VMANVNKSPIAERSLDRAIPSNIGGLYGHARA
jgi:hypothetical protein